MALDESALPELLDALRAGDGVNLIRDAVRLVMQELIELEASEAIGAGRYAIGLTMAALALALLEIPYVPGVRRLDATAKEHELRP